MKEVERKKVPKNNQRKFSANSEKRDYNLQNKSNRKALKAKGTEVQASSAKGDTGIVVSDSNTGSESSEVYESMVIDYVDEVQRSEEASSDLQKLQISEKETDTKRDHSCDVRNEPTEAMEEESDTDTNNDSVSSQGDLAVADDEKVERAAKVLRTVPKNDSSGGNSRFDRVKSDQKKNIIQPKAQKSTPRKTISPDKEPSKGAAKNISDDLMNMKVHPKPPSDSSGNLDTPVEDAKDDDVRDETSVSANCVESDDETLNAKEIGEGEDNADQKIQEMELRIEKLEDELREVAALEVALYSVVPEHGSSAHKVHTPARRLCRLYIHACKHWSPDKRATIARNTVSGLILIAKSCGHDVPRLSFWLSNTVVLREIISQTFGSSCQSGPLTRIFESNGGGKNYEAKLPSVKWKSVSGSKQPKKQGFIQLVDDWQETRTFTTALEKVESWIFSRIVESIWWQALTPHMQSPSDNTRNTKGLGKMLGPNLGDQQKGSFSINLWRTAFEDALRRLCPVRAGGHECGCLSVLARKVMEQCLARLDVAMFNAILRESAHEIPTDPVSDPIVDSRVLPIPAGDLSFGSGAQLKNSVGNWSRCLNDLFGMGGGEDVSQGTGDQPKCFNLLNSLSDLLMLPKDMIMERTIRMEVCPKITLPLLKRILCNFTPDEFCPDSVPGAVLEALNAECIIERRLSGESDSSFPYPAAPVVYTPPSADDVSEKVAEAGSKSQLSRSASAIQRKGYTSDEDLVELDCPLAAIVDKSPSSPSNPPKEMASGNQSHVKEKGDAGGNARYELLREVWQAT